MELLIVTPVCLPVAFERRAGEFRQLLNELCLNPLQREYIFKPYSKTNLYFTVF